MKVQASINKQKYLTYRAKRALRSTMMRTSRREGNERTTGNIAYTTFSATDAGNCESISNSMVMMARCSLSTSGTVTDIWYRQSAQHMHTYLRMEDMTTDSMLLQLHNDHQPVPLLPQTSQTYNHIRDHKLSVILLPLMFFQTSPSSYKAGTTDGRSLYFSCYFQTCVSYFVAVL